MELNCIDLSKSTGNRLELNRIELKRSVGEWKEKEGE